MKDEGLLDSATHSPLNTFYYNQKPMYIHWRILPRILPLRTLPTRSLIKQQHSHRRPPLTPPFLPPPPPSSTQYKLIQTNLPTNTPRVFAPAPQGYLARPTR